jgi:hypothetical protein
MIIDRNKKYFFHNVYGAESALLSSLPNDVVAVPVGWGHEIESERNNVLDSLTEDCADNINASYSTIPDVVFWRPGYSENIEGEILVYPDAWVSLGIHDFTSDTTWSDITQKLQGE